jgi:hypothetical protein
MIEFDPAGGPARTTSGDCGPPVPVSGLHHSPAVLANTVSVLALRHGNLVSVPPRCAVVLQDFLIHFFYPSQSVTEPSHRNKHLSRSFPDVGLGGFSEVCAVRECICGFVCRFRGIGL